MQVQSIQALQPPPDWPRAASEPIAHGQRPSSAPPPAGLTWTQYLIWSHQRLHPQAPLYNVPFTFTIHGPVAAPQFGRAVQAAVAESDSLRSDFNTTADGQPMRRVRQPEPVECEQVDLSGAADPAAAFEAWLSDRSRRPFELDQPLFDTALVSLGASTVWYFNAHHLVVDGGAGPALYERVRAHYEQLLAAGTLAAPVSLAFTDLLAVEAEYSASADYQADADYWQVRGAVPLPPASLYVPPPRAAGVDELAAHRHVFEVGAGRTEALLAWLVKESGAAANANIALLNFWLSLLAVYTHRLSGASPLSLATPFANRRGALAPVIAPLMAEVPVYAALDGATTWRGLLEQTRAESAAAYQHRRYPFQPVIGALPPVVVNLHNWAPCRPLAGQPVSFALRYVPWIDKTLVVHVRPRHQSPTGSLTVELLGRATELTAPQLRQAETHLLNLIDSALAAPGAPIARARLAGTDGSQWTGAALAGTPLDVVAAFEQQAARTPGALAAVCADNSLTYSALQQRAAALAQALRDQGVGPGARVAVWLERSLELPAALLAVLATGAAYLPLDPELPPQRLAGLLADAQVTLALTNERLAARLPGDVRALVVESIAAASAQPLPVVTVSAREPAVLIYTSGSTGQPKGVVISRAALAAHVHSARQAYGLTSADRVLQFAALTFDTATEQIFTALTAGASLVLRGPVAWTASELAAVLRTQRVTVANLPTAYWQHVTADWAAQPSAVEGVSLRLVLVGGEALPAAALARWGSIPALAAVSVLNVYGPTETTVTALAAEVTDTSLEARVPLGGPLPGRTAAIVDRYGAPQPQGAAGELVLGGLGVADGYWRAPELTRARFEQGRYHTGDLAYARPDGVIGYLGRGDRQVKVRGVRVEPAEIEAALTAHPAVQAAAVVAQPTGDEVTLVAYLASAAPAAELIPLLREHLRPRLPAAMLPGAWSVQPALPLTLHGKVDYAALTALPVITPRLATAPTAEVPATALEVTLLNLWREVLRQPHLGRHDNFFEAGGHSLLAARLFARLENELGARLPVATLALASTVAELAHHLATTNPDHAWPLLVRLTPGGTRPPLFCVHGFGGGVLGYLDLARSLGPDQPFLALAARGLDGNQEPDDDVTVMAARYLDVVRAAQPQGPYYLAGYCFGGVVAYELAVQLTRAGQAVAFVGLFEGYAPNLPGALTASPAGAALSFARNLPHWVKDFAGLQARHWCERQGGPAAEGRVTTDEAALAQVRHIQAQHDLALQRYVPATYGGAVHLFRARGHALRRALDPLRGWGRLAAGGVQLHLLPGSHYNILERPHVTAFARQLAAALAASQTSSAGP